MNFTAVELAMMIEAHAGKRGDQSSEGFEFCGAESRGGAGFVVIFEKARSAALRGDVGGEARVNFVNVAVVQGVVKAFVVGELKAEGLNGGFAVPVDFGEPDKFLRQSRDGFSPEFARRRFASGEERAPSTRENIVQDEHSHVAANAVAVLGDFAEFGDERGAGGRLEIIELQNVAPRREIRIAAVSEKDWLGGGFLQIECGGIFAKILLSAANVKFGMRGGPRMVGSSVVGDEVENEADAASAELFAGVVEIGPGADARIRLILADGIGRADDLTEFPARKGLVESRETGRIELEKSATYGAALPDAHEPNEIEAETGNLVPFSGRNVAQSDATTIFCGELFEPSPSIDFVKMRMGAIGKRGWSGRAGHFQEGGYAAERALSTAGGRAEGAGSGQVARRCGKVLTKLALN